MSSESRCVRLAEVADLTVGGIWGTDNPTATSTIGVYCLRGVDVDSLARGAGANPPKRFISAKQLASRELRFGDIVIEASGSNCGRSIAASNAISDAYNSPLVYSNFCKRIRVRNPERWNPFYVWRVLQSAYADGYVQQFRTGSALPNLDVKQLVAELRIPSRPMGEQRAIAEVLGSLDERIAWAQAARLKVLDCAHAVWASESTAESRDVTVGDIAMFHNRRRIPLSARERESRPGPYPYYGATGQFGSVDDYRFDGNFVLVGEDGSVVNLDGTPIVQYVSNRFWVNNHAHVLTSEELRPEELFLALQRVNVSGYVTGAAQPKLSMGRLKQVPISLPLQESIEQARPTIAALFESFRGLAGEVEVLRTTRDALLPKLVSGEIRIEDPERLLDQVA